MKLDLINELADGLKNSNFIQSFINELQEYLKTKVGGEIILDKHNERKMITKYEDKMLLERNRILNNYAKQTNNKGEMYYIYSKNSKNEDRYNLCICEENRSHDVIEVSINELPNGVAIGSILRKNENGYCLDEEATRYIMTALEDMKDKILEEQTQYLNSKRIEGHVYEISEIDNDRAWLFDTTSNSNEGIEEIDFPIELLQNSDEGDLFVYQNGEYKKR